MITAVLLGIVLGILTGVLPGIGVTTLLLSMYVTLSYFSIPELFVFYAVLMTSLQYYGNVASILYGVYGEITSGPAVKHGYSLFQERTQYGIDALIYTATGSFIASLLALGLIAVAFEHGELLAKAFGNTIKVLIVTVAMLVLVLSSKNKLFGLVAGLTGVVCGKIGYDTLFDMRILSGTSSNIMDGGIPSAAVFVGLLALPQLIEIYKSKTQIDVTNWKDTGLVYRLKTIVKMPYKMAALRGSIIGLATGIIPGISYAVSSAVANAVEERLCKKQNQNSVDTRFRCVISAESANNAGSMIVLIPLLILAIPVIPSEAIIYSIAERSGYGFSISHSFLLSYGSLIVSILFFVNLFNWVLSGVFYNFVAKMFTCLKSYIYQFLIIFLIFIVAISAAFDNQLLLSLAFLFLFTGIGLIIKDEKIKITFLFAFFLADPIVNEYYRFILLNF